MTLEKVKLHPYWLELNEKERAYLEHLAVNPDRMAAVQAAYNLKPKSVAPMLGKLEGRFEVSALVNLLTRGTILPGKEEVLGLIWQRLKRTRDPKASAKLAALYHQFDRNYPEDKAAAPEISLDDFPDPVQ